jgi:hypothetical protein
MENWTYRWSYGPRPVGTTDSPVVWLGPGMTQADSHRARAALVRWLCGAWVASLAQRAGPAWQWQRSPRGPL